MDTAHANDASSAITPRGGQRVALTAMRSVGLERAIGGGVVVIVMVVIAVRVPLVIGDDRTILRRALALRAAA